MTPVLPAVSFIGPQESPTNAGAIGGLFAEGAEAASVGADSTGGGPLFGALLAKFLAQPAAQDHTLPGGSAEEVALRVAPKPEEEAEVNLSPLLLALAAGSSPLPSTTPSAEVNPPVAPLPASTGPWLISVPTHLPVAAAPPAPVPIASAEPAPVPTVEGTATAFTLPTTTTPTATPPPAAPTSSPTADTSPPPASPVLPDQLLPVPPQRGATAPPTTSEAGVIPPTQPRTEVPLAVPSTSEPGPSTLAPQRSAPLTPNAREEAPARAPTASIPVPPAANLTTPAVTSYRVEFCRVAVEFSTNTIREIEPRRPAREPVFTTSVHAAPVVPTPPRPAAQTATAPVDQVARAILGQVEVLYRERHTEIQLRLDPPELGSVEVRLSITEYRVHAHLVVADEGACRLLQSQVEHMRQRLLDAGIQLGNCDVSQGGGSGGQSRDSHPRPLPWFDAPLSLPAATPVPTTRAMVRLITGRLDVVA